MTFTLPPIPTDELRIHYGNNLKSIFELDNIPICSSSLIETLVCFFNFDKSHTFEEITNNKNFS